MCIRDSNDPVKLSKLAIINRYHMQQYAYLLGKLKAVKEGDGCLLYTSRCV